MARDLSNNKQIIGAISCLNSFKTPGFISSGPAALSGFRFASSLSTPFKSIKSLALMGTYISESPQSHPKISLEHTKNNLTKLQGAILEKQTGIVYLTKWLCHNFLSTKYL